MGRGGEVTDVLADPAPGPLGQQPPEGMRGACREAGTVGMGTEPSVAASLRPADGAAAPTAGAPDQGGTLPRWGAG